MWQFVCFRYAYNFWQRLQSYQRREKNLSLNKNYARVMCTVLVYRQYWTIYFTKNKQIRTIQTRTKKFVIFFFHSFWPLLSWSYFWRWDSTIGCVLSWSSVFSSIFKLPKIQSIMSFGKWCGNSYTKFVALDINSNLYWKMINNQNIMTWVV